MAEEVEVDSYELFAPRGRKLLTNGGFYGSGCFNKSVENRVGFYFLPKETQRTKLRDRDREAFVRHGAGPGA